MATWEWNRVFGYRDSDDGLLQASVAGTRNLSDQDGADDFFTGGEVLRTAYSSSGTIPPVDNEGTFIGTVDYLGSTWVGVQVSGWTLFFANTTESTAAVRDAFPEAAAEVPLSNQNSFLTCFATGTLIATPKGERAVETLQRGDIVSTADSRSVSVVWIGHQSVHK